MTDTFEGQRCGPDDTSATAPHPNTWRERALVLGGFAVAALYTAVSAAAGTGMEAAGALWLAAVLWTVPTSLALALRRGLRNGDWSAFHRYELPDGRDERIDAATQSGQYAYLEVAEEHERLMRGD